MKSDTLRQPFDERNLIPTIGEDHLIGFEQLSIAQAHGRNRAFVRDDFLKRHAFDATDELAHFGEFRPHALFDFDRPSA